MKQFGFLVSMSLISILLLPSAASVPTVDTAQPRFAPIPMLADFTPIKLPPGVPLLPGLDVRVTNDPKDQNEVSVAVNPSNARNMLIGANDARGPGANGQEWWCGAYATFDAGLHWSMGLLPQQAGLANYTAAGDPSVGFDHRGNAFFTCLGFVRQTSNSTIVNAKSTDGGLTFQPPVTVAAGALGAPFHDKPYMAIDNSPLSPYRGNVYVSWTNFSDLAGGTSPIYFSRSTNAGATFSAPKRISGGLLYDQGSQPSVGPNGEVYVSFEAHVGAQARLYVVRSDDGGNTFGTPVQAAPIREPGNTLPPGDYRTPTIPSSATDNGRGPYSGSVYAVWQDGSLGNSDILLVYSRDKGMTWSSPIKVNTDTTTNDQFFPFISVARNGRVDVVFYDRRNDPSNFLLDVFAGVSYDGGVSFRNRRITDAQIDPGTTIFIGDYIGVTSLNDSFYPGWCGVANGQEEIFMEEAPALRFVAVRA